jgi:hypothetical protein
MSGYSARLTAKPGLWAIWKDGVEVGSIAFLDSVPRAQLHVDQMIAVLNHPPRPQRFGGPAAAMIDARRRATKDQP